MSSLRVQKIFEGLVDQLKRLGGYSQITDLRAPLIWQGRVDGTLNATDAGKDALVLDIDGATWAAGHRRAVIVATAADSNPSVAAMHTQSHAAGNVIDGSVRFQVYLETPSAWTDAEAKFDRLLTHMFLGQLGAPVELLYCAHSTQPVVAGVQAVTTSATFTTAGSMLPYGGISYPGGV